MVVPRRIYRGHSHTGVGVDSGDYDEVGTKSAELGVEVCAKKRAVALLHDDHVILRRG